MSERDSQTSSIRESLNAAYEEVEKRTNATTVEAPADDSGSVGSGGDRDAPGDLAGGASSKPDAEAKDGGEKGLRVRGPDGKFLKADAKAAESKTAPVKVEAKTETKAAPVVEAAATPAPVPAVVTPTYKAPQSWKADVREKFATLPPEVQAEIIRIENDTKQALQGTSEPKKLAEQFKQVVGPYEHMIRAEGGEPIKAIGSLLQTAAALRTGTPQTKAQLVAQMIQGYGIDVPTLAKILDGQPVQAQQQQPQMMDPAEYARKVAEHSRAQMEEERISQAVEEFSKTEREFMADVEPIMQGIVAAARARGEAPTAKLLQDAYDRACWAVPEVRAVLTQRDAAKSAQAAQAASQQKANASVSAKSQPSGVSSAGPMTRRQMLEAAAAKHNGGR